MRKTIPAVVVVSDVLGGARIFYDDPPALTRKKANYRLGSGKIALAENVEQVSRAAHAQTHGKGSGSRFKTAVYTKVVMGDTVIHWVITTLTTLTIMMSSFKYWVFFAAL